MPYIFALPDELMVRLLTEKYKLPQKLMHITGQPDYDQWANFDIMPKRKEVRAVLGLKEDEHFIIYAGQTTPNNTETLQWVIDDIMSRQRKNINNK